MNISRANTYSKLFHNITTLDTNKKKILIQEEVNLIASDIGNFAASYLLLSMMKFLISDSCSTETSRYNKSCKTPSDDFIICGSSYVIKELTCPVVSTIDKIGGVLGLMLGITLVKSSISLAKSAIRHIRIPSESRIQNQGQAFG